MNLEQRIQRLEDIEAIKQLRARYCYLVDAGCNANDRAKLEELVDKYFSKDISIDFGSMGVYDKYDDVVNFFTRTVPGAQAFCVHMVHNPLITVDGDTATGEWYFEAPSIARKNGKSTWLQGRYEERYVREAGQWKFAFVRADFNAYTYFGDFIARAQRFVRSMQKSTA